MTSTTSPAPAAAAGRPLAPLLALCVAGVLLLAVAAVLDSRPDVEGLEGWGYLLPVAVYGVVGGSWVLGASLLCGLVATLSSSMRVRQQLTVAAAVTAAATGALLAIVGVVVVVQASATPDLVFGCVMVLSGGVAMVPARSWLPGRRR